MNRKQVMFGNKLRELRMQKNFTQEQLGDLVDVSANAIGQFERGIMYPNFETLHRIICALEVDANLFFSNSFVECPEPARLFAALIKDMEQEEQDAIGKFLNDLSRVLTFPKEDENL